MMFNPANRISQDVCAWDWGGNMVVHKVLQNPRWHATGGARAPCRHCLGT